MSVLSAVALVTGCAGARSPAFEVTLSGGERVQIPSCLETDRRYGAEVDCSEEGCSEDYTRGYVDVHREEGRPEEAAHCVAEMYLMRPNPRWAFIAGQLYESARRLDLARYHYQRAAGGDDEDTAAEARARLRALEARTSGVVEARAPRRGEKASAALRRAPS